MDNDLQLKNKTDVQTNNKISLEAAGDAYA